MKARATMVTRHGLNVKEPAVAYTLISSRYEISTIGAQELAHKITTGSLDVTNLAVEGGKIVSTNGAMDKYTFINVQTHQVEGKPSGVIIDRFEEKGKLVGYTIFLHTGRLKTATVAEAVSLQEKGLIANGKIRHTDSGDIVSSIKGEYNIREVKPTEAPKGKLKASTGFVAGTIGVKSHYVGVILSATSASRLSEVYKVLHESNMKLSKEAVAAAGSNEEAAKRASVAFEPIRIDAAEVYIVIDIATFKQLLKIVDSVEFGRDGVLRASCVKYTATDTIESCVEVTDKGKIVKAISEGGSETKAELKKIVLECKEIISKARA